jgi:hypothetical protein
MTDRAVTSARWAECHRRMEAAGISPAQFAFHDAAYMRAVVADEQAGLWSPFPTEDVPSASLPGPSPVASAPVPAPAAADPTARSRSIWAKATTEANSELALSEPAPPAEPQADATTGATQMPPAGSEARSRSAWGKAVADANSELMRRGGRVGEA